MSRITLSSGGTKSAPVPIGTWDNLRTALDNLRNEFQGQNILIRLQNESGDELMVGFGSTTGTATITAASGTIVSIALNTSDGKRQRGDKFHWGPHTFDVDAQSLISISDVYLIAKQWMADGTLSENVKWDTSNHPLP